MLENSLAEKLIEQVTKYTSYNVNIMNEQGVIIASRNPERIGKFHEVAWQIVHGTSDIMVTENDNEYPGVLSGINMVIDIEGKREGVVGVTGNPEEIRPIALIIKMAIETLIKYENQKMQAFRRQTRKDRFMEMLTQKQYRAPQDIQKLASELNYRRIWFGFRFFVTCSHLYIRMPFIVHKNSPAHLTQDISFKIEDRYILIFKTLKEEHLFSDYRFLLADYLKSTLKWMREEGIVCTFYIGTFQTSFSQYYYAYQHCKWLERHASGEHQAFYFYDFTGEYLMSCIPRQELQRDI
ncbi:MAG: sugar diacid recognition domain-containing protein [Mediterraneibacter gnavus]